MRILVASPYPERIKDAFRYGEDEVVYWHRDWNPEALGVTNWSQYDWVVSYGYRYIIKPDVIAACPRIVNIHISYLPWNRGSDPNFWSWIDDTPKGISIHQIDAGIDTGPIYSQINIDFNDKHTLKTSYDRLRYKAENHFMEVWPDIRDGIYVARPQNGVGSSHRKADKDELFARLPLGWDTPILDLAALKA